MSLSLVTQVWSRALADLEPIPPEKLNVLLQVCVGNAYESNKPKDAGEVLQRALPLALFLVEGQGKHGNQIVPQLTNILAELPQAWHAVQNSPLHTQADYTQLMVHLRGLMRDPDIPDAMQQQLSRAVKLLLEQLLSTVTQQQQQQQLTTSSWVKSGCNLLLRALTRSVQFIQDPILPLLPADAFETLKWLQHTSMGTRAQPKTAVALVNSAADGSNSSDADASDRISASGPAIASVADGNGGSSTGSASAGKILLRDDKVYLLLTKLVFTATGMPAGSFDPQGTYVQPVDAQRAADVSSHPSDNSSAAVPAATAPPAANGANRSVVWSSTLSTAAAGRHHHHQHHSQGICSPGALHELLEWSSSKVKQAMQQLLEPEGGAGERANVRKLVAVVARPQSLQGSS